MIAPQTAYDIAVTYQEIERAEKLLEEVRAVIKARSTRWEEAEIRDNWGRRVDGLQLGVPSDSTGSRRLFNVPFELAEPVIEAHIASQKAALRALNAKARIELNAALSRDPKPEGGE